MKFKINQDHFVTGLQQVLNVVGSRAAMPILSNVLIQAEADNISLTTTNLDLGIRCQIKAEVEVPGGITLPVRKLATIVRSLPNKEIKVESGEGKQVHIASGGSNFKMMGMAAEEFPSLPTFENQHVFNLPQKDLLDMLKRVSYAQSTDENRYILNSVYFNFATDQLTLVATDGRRLAVTSREQAVADSDTGHLILPAKTITELERLLDQGENVQIAFSDRQAAFKIQTGKDSDSSGMGSSIYLVSKIVEGNYPNYQQVIPKETEHRIKVDRELLLECVQRATLVTSDRSNSICISVEENLLEISASSVEYGEARESIAIQYEGPKVSISFNPHYLMDPLKALPHDEVFFEFKDELSPGVYRTLDSFLCVVMPLRG